MFNVSMNDIQQIDDTHKEEHEDYKQESNGEDRQEKQRSKTKNLNLGVDQNTQQLSVPTKIGTEKGNDRKSVSEMRSSFLNGMKKYQTSFQIQKRKYHEISSSEKDSKTIYQMEITEKMKNILMCSISHEFRSPVNHINGILELLEKNCQNDQKNLRFIKIALSSVEMLTSKIDDILDYALLETNTLTLKHIDFDIRRMLKEIEKILNLQFDHKMLSFSIFVANDVPENILYDYKRLKQILLNLVFNAMKHTENGYVSVIVDCNFLNNNSFKYKGVKSLSREYNNEVELRFAVSDSGCGIEKKKRMNLFELFNNATIDNYKLESDKDMIESGELMGIGLAFCQKMLKRMNSKLELSSVIDVGSTFSFKIKAEFLVEKVHNKYSKKFSSKVDYIKNQIGLHKNFSEQKNENQAQNKFINDDKEDLPPGHPGIVKFEKSSSYGVNTYNKAACEPDGQLSPLSKPHLERLDSERFGKSKFKRQIKYKKMNTGLVNKNRNNELNMIGSMVISNRSISSVSKDSNLNIPSNLQIPSYRNSENYNIPQDLTDENTVKSKVPKFINNVRDGWHFPLMSSDRMSKSKSQKFNRYDSHLQKIPIIKGNLESSENFDSVSERRNEKEDILFRQNSRLSSHLSVQRSRSQCKVIEEEKESLEGSNSEEIQAIYLSPYNRSNKSNRSKLNS